MRPRWLVGHRLVPAETRNSWSQFCNASCHTRRNSTNQNPRVKIIDLQFIKRTCTNNETWDAIVGNNLDSVHRELRRHWRRFKNIYKEMYSTVASVNYKPKMNQKYQMKWYEKLHSSDSQHTKADCRDEASPLGNYSEYGQVFIQISNPFYTKWETNLGRIRVAKNHIALIYGAALVHSVLHWAGPKVREFQRPKVAKPFNLWVVGPTSFKTTVQIVFETKNLGTLCFCVGYGRLNEVIQRAS